MIRRHLSARAIALALIISGCTSEPDIRDCNAPEFYASTEAWDATRTILGEENSQGDRIVAWSGGERIMVSSGAGRKAVSYYVTKDSGESAMFMYDKEKDGNTRPERSSRWAAFYPAEHYSYSGGLHRMTLPEHQNFIKGQIESGVLPMTAFSDSHELEFRHLCGVIRIRLSTLQKDVLIQSVTLSAEKCLSGDIVQITGDEKISWVTEEGSESSNSVTLDCSNGIKAEAYTEDFMIAVPPSEYTRLKISLHIKGQDGISDKVYMVPGPVIVERAGMTDIVLDLSQFSSVAGDGIGIGDEKTAITSAGYVFDGAKPVMTIFKEGGEGSLDIRSILQQEYSNGDNHEEGIPWHAEFSMDNGTTWSMDIPEMFTEFTTSSTGGSGASSINYAVSPSSEDRECDIKIIQDISGKEIPIRVFQMSSAIIAKYRTPTERRTVVLCSILKNNVSTIILDDEIVLGNFRHSESTMNIYYKIEAPGEHTAILKIDKASGNLESLFKSDYQYSQYYCLVSADLTHLDFSHVTSFRQMFWECTSLTSITFPEGPLDTGKVTDMNGMFYDCSHITSLDVSGLDTSATEDMKDMFCRCYILEKLDVSHFDTGKVKDMSYMFFCCRKLEALDVSGFKTGNVTSMLEMFGECNLLKELDISGFDTGEVRSFAAMFTGCKLLESLDVSGFKTSNSASFSSMFKECTSITYLDVSGFDTSQAVSMSGMFERCGKLRTIDVSNFNTENVQNMSSMFERCSSLSVIDVSGFRTPNLSQASFMFSSCGVESLDLGNFIFTNMEQAREMFGGTSKLKSLTLKNFCSDKLVNCYCMISSSGIEYLEIDGFRCGKGCNMHSMMSNNFKLKTLIIRDFDARRATDMGYMFSQCGNLEEMDLSTMYTEDVTKLDSMFGWCYKVKHLDISGMRTSNVTSMNYMFNCAALEELDVSRFDTRNATDMGSMFCGCESLKKLDLSNFNTEKVTMMYSMFEGCCNLSELNLSSFRTPELKNTYAMFRKCYCLTELDLSGFTTDKLTDAAYMFYHCNMLKSLDITHFTAASIEKAGSMFSYCLSLKELDIRNMVFGEMPSKNDIYREEDGLKSFLRGSRNLNEIYMDLSKAGDSFMISSMFNEMSPNVTLHLKDGIVSERIKALIPETWTVIPFQAQ